MDDDALPRSRRQRPKDSFQNELQAKLHQRKSLGLSADITDSEDDAFGQSHTTTGTSMDLNHFFSATMGYFHLQYILE